MIPARLEASRFPGKLMKSLGDKTVILHTYEAAVSTQLFDAVYVVTDSDVIEEEIAKHGGSVIRSKQSHQSGSDRIAEAVQGIDTDIVVNVQGDEPFIDKESLQKVLQVFHKPDAATIDLASLMTEITDWDEINNPNTVKVVVDEHNFALYFSRSPIPYPRDEHSKKVYYKHKGIYAFRKKAIQDFAQLPMKPLESAEKIECLRYLEHGRRIKMAVHNMESVEIDTPEDLEHAQQLLNKRTNS